MNLPVSGGHSPRVKVSSGIAGIPGRGSRRVADSKLTSFVPLTKRRAILSWILVSKLNRAASRIRGSKNDRRTVAPLEPNESPCYLGASGSRRSLRANDIFHGSNRGNRGGVPGSCGKSNLLFPRIRIERTTIGSEQIFFCKFTNNFSKKKRFHESKANQKLELL